MFSSVKALLRPAYFRLWVLPRVHRTYRSLSVRDAFQRVYESGAWGAGSGRGSRGAWAAYSVEQISAFIRERGVRSIVDLGCGDFEVGRKIIEHTGVTYTGVDVVPSLIDHHSKNFSGERVSFVCANLITDTLPMGDLCMVRQVLQHLSNAEIEAVLRNIAHYPMVLISEHVPTLPKSFNRDKPHGPDVRPFWGSGVYIDMPPFSRKADQLWEREIEPGEVLRTVLLVRNSS
jgi:SAM-dependent methyltransferase